MGFRQTKIFLLLLFFCLQWTVVYAQKSKRNKKNDKLASETKIVRTEKNFIDGERYFLLEDYTKALGYFQKALDTDPKSGTIHYKIAEVYIKEKDYSKAEIYAIEALKLNPSKKYFYLLLADIKNRKSQFGQAAEIYEEMINTVPGTEGYLVDLAAIYIFNNQLQKGLKTYNRVEKQLGVSPDVFMERMKLYDRLEQTEKGDIEIKRLIAYYPDELTYQLIWVNRLMVKQDFNTASDILTKLNEKHPLNVDILLNLAEIYQLQSKTKEYIDIITDLMENKGVDFETKLTLVNLLLDKRNGKDLYSNSLSVLKKLADDYPTQYKAHLLFADHLYAAGKKEKALNEYIKVVEVEQGLYEVWANILKITYDLKDVNNLKKYSDLALEIYPNQAFLYFMKGMGEVLDDQYKPAKQYLQDAKDLAVTDLVLWEQIQLSIASIDYRLKNIKESFKIYEEIISQNPNNYEAINNYCFYSAVQKTNLMRARALGLQLVRANEDNPHYLDTFGWVLYQLKEYKEAKRYLERAISISNGNNQSIIEHYGDALFRLGQRDKAIAQWEKAEGLKTSERLAKKIAERKITDD